MQTRTLTSSLCCRLCGARLFRQRERRGRFQYVQCLSCSLAFVANPPDERKVLDQYRLGASSKLAYYRMAAQADADSFATLMDVAARYTPGGGRILDVGCNIGTFVRVARDRGWQATGVDVNNEVVYFGRAGSGLNLLTLDEYEAQPDLTFDVIHSSDTVEHFAEPTRIMKRYVRRLRPGGLLVVSTPNYDSRLCKIFQLKPTEHLFLFNRQSLAFMLRALGLDIVDTLFFDRYRNISAMFESTTFDHVPLLKRLFRVLYRLRPELRLRLNGAENVVALARATRGLVG
jgi:2-polyprenyl-3-methyl-5-hydroxy-6-metoxy-1,4-benzoquinol methylase